MSEEDELKEFREVVNRLDGAYTSFAKYWGLSNAEYWSLIMLGEGTTTQQEISQEMAMSRQTVNSAFKALIEKKWVYLQVAPNNLRVKNAFLTASGRDVSEKLIGQLHQFEKDAWHQLPDEQRQALNAGMKNFAQSLLTSSYQLNHSSEDPQSKL